MKKIIFVALLAMFLQGNSNAQTYLGLNGGLNFAKTNISQEQEFGTSDAESYKVERMVLLRYGGFLSNGLGTKGKLNLQAGFYVSEKGYEANADYRIVPFYYEVTTDYKVKYLEVPVLLKLVLGKPNVKVDPYIIGGGYWAKARKAHYDFKEKALDANTYELLNTFEYASDHKPYDDKDLVGSNPFLNGTFLNDKADLGYVFGGGFAFNIGGPKIFIEAQTSKSLKSKSVFVDFDGKLSDPKVRNNVFTLSLGLMVPISNGKTEFDWDK